MKWATRTRIQSQDAAAIIHSFCTCRNCEISNRKTAVMGACILCAVLRTYTNFHDLN